MTKKDPFDVLGISRDSSPGDVRDAYLALARVRHPDRGGTPEEFSELVQAYWDAQATASVCPVCGGLGETVVGYRVGAGAREFKSSCGACRGTGRRA